ncbi:MAG: type II secretion system protein GspF [Alphaproteobacteria bacterium]|nr:type II secretion system protein GspF [Alphaproteobacteria bacterium]
MAPAFEYEALDGGGRVRKGVVSAETPRLARAELRRLKLTPVAMTAARERDRTSERRGNARISSAQLVTLTRQLAVLVGASIPIEEALNAVAMQVDRPNVRRRLTAARERVLEGRTFADALRQDGGSFSDLYCAVVAAGEASGKLDGTLDRLATMLEKNRSMRSKAIGALIYPAVLFLFAGGVVGALMTQVVPRIIEQFQSFDAELPAVTLLVVAMSGFLADYGLILIASIALALVGLWRALKVKPFRRQFDKALLATPVIGGLLRGLDGARFARTLSTLFGGDAPLLDSLTGARRTILNVHIGERVDAAIDQVREGASLAAAIRRADALPPMMTHMVAAGERAGSLPKLLDKAAEELEEEFDSASTIALRLLEPAVIVVMGGFVLLITLAIMLPILRLNSLAAM